MALLDEQDREIRVRAGVLVVASGGALAAATKKS